MWTLWFINDQVQLTKLYKDWIDKFLKWYTQYITDLMILFNL